MSEDEDRIELKPDAESSDKKSDEKVSKTKHDNSSSRLKKSVLVMIIAVIAVAIIALLFLFVNGNLFTKEDSYFQIGDYSLSEEEYLQLEIDAKRLGVFEDFREELTETVADIEAAKKVEIEVTEEEILVQDSIISAPYLDDNIASLSYEENGWRQLASQREAYLLKVNSLEQGSYEGAVLYFPFDRHLTISVDDDQQDELLGDEATIEADRQYAKQKADEQVALLSDGADRARLEKSIAQIRADDNLNYSNLTNLFGYNEKAWAEDIALPDITELVTGQNSTGVGQVVALRQPVDVGDPTSEVVDVGYVVIYVEKVVQSANTDTYAKFILERESLVKT